MDERWTQDVQSAATFPLPFRVLFLLSAGVLAWATNLHGLRLHGIDGPSVLRLDRSSSPTIRSPGSKQIIEPSPLYRPIYRLFFNCATWCLFIWVVYRYSTINHVEYVDVFKYLPAVGVLGLMIGLVCPYDVLELHEREKFLFAIYRCLTPQKSGVSFSDVVLADIFTSYAKVFGDLWLSLWMLLPGGSLLALPPQDGWSRWVLPTLMSVPYLIRFRQCLAEYRAPLNQSRRPLYNAVKYATSFPVIYLSAAQRIVVSELMEERGGQALSEPWHGEYQLFRLWLLAALINSLYSFWWDITNDWGFDLLRSKSTQGESVRPHPFGLRTRLLYPLAYYPFIVLANLILRLTWSVKLSLHLHSHSEGIGVIFWTEVAELVRRWMWVFLRVEWEILKGKTGNSRGSGA